MKYSFCLVVNILFFIFSFLNIPTGLAAGNNWEEKILLQVDNKFGTSLKSPSALYIDVDKSIYYVVDTGNNRLLSFSKDGEMLLAFNANSKLSTPFDMVKGDDGTLWVVEKDKKSLTEINLQSHQITQHIVVDQGNEVIPHRLEKFGSDIFILDKKNGQIVSINSKLEITNRYNCDDCQYGFSDFKVTDEGIFALALHEQKLYHFTYKGGLINAVGFEKKMQFPVSFAIGNDEKIYVLDRHKGSINVFDREGKFVYSFLSSGQNRGNLYYPVEISLDPWGRICVVDEGNGRVEIFSR